MDPYTHPCRTFGILKILPSIGSPPIELIIISPLLLEGTPYFQTHIILKLIIIYIYICILCISHEVISRAKIQQDAEIPMVDIAIPVVNGDRLPSETPPYPLHLTEKHGEKTRKKEIAGHPKHVIMYVNMLFICIYIYIYVYIRHVQM